MNPLDSFDPASGPQRYEHLANIEFLTQVDLANSNLANSDLTNSNLVNSDLVDQQTEYDDISASESELLSSWQDQLLPFSCIAAEDNVTVLRMELEKAHQLLQCQQGMMDALNENLTNRDLNLRHTQEVLDQAQQACDRQSTKIAELEAICRDFKVQLRRQQQRVLKYRNGLNEQTTLNSILLPTLQPAMESATYARVSVGYEAISIESTLGTVKPPPVAAWSAPESIDLTGPLACYRKLAMIRMTSTTLQMDAIPQPSPSANVEWRSHKTQSTNAAINSLPESSPESKPESKPPTPQNFRIELPTFAKTSH